MATSPDTRAATDSITCAGVKVNGKELESAAFPRLIPHDLESLWWWVSTRGFCWDMLQEVIPRMMWEINMDLERKTRLELATFSLARRRSTTELLPLVLKVIGAEREI